MNSVYATFVVTSVAAVSGVGKTGRENRSRYSYSVPKRKGAETQFSGILNSRMAESKENCLH